MQVLDVDGGGGPTGNHSVAMQSLSDHGKSEAFMKIRAEITFPILTAFKSSLQR